MDASAGSGNDNFLIRGSVIRELQAVMEGARTGSRCRLPRWIACLHIWATASDWLLFSNSIVNEATQADGGDGQDLLTLGGSLLAGLATNGIEFFQ